MEEQLRQLKMTTTVATDYDNIEIQQQYSDVNNRWDVDDWDNENSSARLFERSRIKALAGKSPSRPVTEVQDAFQFPLKSSTLQDWLTSTFEHVPREQADHFIR